MKKHPIDELFARKLAEHRQEPSQKAFEKFQARLQEKQTRRRGGIFAFNRNWGYYAAAAGVVAALTIGILSQNNTPDTQMAVNRAKPEIEVPANTPASQQNADILAKTNISTEKAINTVEQSAPARPAYDIARIKVAENPAKDTQPGIAKETPGTVDEPANNIAQHQPQEARSFQVETLTGRNTSAIQTMADNHTDIAAKYPIKEPVVLIIAPLEESTAGNTADTETSVEEKAEKEKSFLAKLYGEYKHFKYGEKVDLKRLGVKDAVARVDETLLKEEREDVRDFVQRRIGRMTKRE